MAMITTAIILIVLLQLINIYITYQLSEDIQESLRRTKPSKPAQDIDNTTQEGVLYLTEAREASMASRMDALNSEVEL